MKTPPPAPSPIESETVWTVVNTREAYRTFKGLIYQRLLGFNALAGGPVVNDRPLSSPAGQYWLGKAMGYPHK